MAARAPTSNTTFPEGACPQLKKLDMDTFQCPLCDKAGGYAGLIAHLQGHQWSTVKYGGFSVYKCHLGCVASSHYHCGFCPRVIARKELFFNHFKKCCSKLSPPPAPTAEGTMALATLVTAPLTDAPGTAPVYTLTTAEATTATIAHMTVPAKGRHISTAPNMLSKCKKITCCFCHLELQKKNLKMHIQRHHSPKPSDVTAQHHLQSVCVDKRRGIFAVSRTFKSPVPCIHVQKYTWGINHQVSCQLEKCKRAYDYAWKSGLMGFDCDHIRSLVYCPVAGNAVTLDEEILTEMAVNKWVSKETQSECLRRKVAADAEGAPLSVEVDLGQENGHIYFSVVEPHISSNSRFGRVMVHYDNTRNAWHCPCTKPRKWCPHKSIAKWHLHQSRADFFQQLESCHEDDSETFSAEASSAIDDTRGESNPLDPPEGKVIVEMVEHVISHEALPANLPET